MYRELIKEVGGIIEERKPKIWHQGSIGRDGLMRLVALGVYKKREIFGLPQFVTDAPFPDKLWWAAVDSVWGTQEMWTTGGTLVRGIEHQPNYSLVVRTWKKLVADEYGFEPTASKDVTLTKQVQKEVSKAAKLMGAAANKAKQRMSKEEWDETMMGNELSEELPHFDETIFGESAGFVTEAGGGQFVHGDLVVAIKDGDESGVQGLKPGQKWFVLAVDKAKNTMVVSLVGVKADLGKLVLRVTSSVVGDVFKKV